MKRSKPPISPANAPVRVNRYLAEAGICSRRAADTMIAECRVTINGAPAALGATVSPGDAVAVDGKTVSLAHHKAYVLLNKPKDCITTASDERGRRTVVEIVNYRDRVFPVGRLDRNTTGVLILTNDGELAHRLAHPRYGVEKTYRVALDSPLERADAKRLAEGVVVDGARTAPCGVEINPADASELALTMHEGRNRQVRRMFEHLGYRVVKLDRIRYAGLTARGLRRGQWRRLTRAEIAHLRSAAHLDEPA